MIRPLYPHARPFRAYGGGTSLDKTRFVGFYEASDEGNTNGNWVDQSGHGNHFTQTDPTRQLALEVDPNGLTRYNFNPGGATRYFNSQLSSGQSDFTFYLVATLTSPRSPNYLFDCQGHILLLSSAPGDAGLYYSTLFGVKGGSLALPAGLSLTSWNLSEAAGGTVTSNGQVLLQASYVKSYLNAGRLGQDYSDASYGAVQGYIYAFAVALGSDTPAQAAEAEAYFKAKYHLAY